MAGPRRVGQTLVFGIAGIALVLAGVHVAGSEAQVHASDPPGTDASFEVDVDTGADGIQTTRSVAVGSSFNVEVSINTTDGLPWEAYQVTLDYDDVVLDAVGPDSDWDTAPVEGVNGGNVFAFTTGAFCTPPTQSGAIFTENDSGTAQWALTCTEITSATNHTGEGALVRFTFTCEESGTADLDLRDVADTFLLDAAFSQFNDHVHNASVTCGGDAPTATPAPPTATPGAASPTPAAAEPTVSAPAPTTTSGGAAPAGVSGPDTGTGHTSGSGAALWAALIGAAVSLVAGTSLSAAGAAVRRRARR